MLESVLKRFSLVPPNGTYPLCLFLASIYDLRKTWKSPYIYKLDNLKLYVDSTGILTYYKMMNCWTFEKYFQL